MSVLQKFSSTVFNVLRINLNNTLSSATVDAVPTPGGLFNVFVRYNIRNHFPRPSERKRIKRHGWNKRMSTRSGQKIIMRNILKGKHVLSH